MKRKIRFMVIAIFLLMGFSVFSQPITEVTWVTPDWEGLTNKNGTGLYHEVLSKIYSRAGIKVHVVYEPWARSVIDVQNGKADFTGGDSPSDKFAQPKIPIFTNVEMAFFKKTTIPSYHGVSDLDGKRGVWVLGYTDNMPENIKNHLMGKGSPSRTAAIKMVLSGRADYYLDNEYQMTQQLNTFKGQYAKSEYMIDHVYTENLLLCFTKSPRGQQLADLFDQGMKKLSASGELKKIYIKWNSSIPPVK